MRTVSGVSARAAEAKRRARRVPEDQRKRGVQSCDLCRKKRCRCIPAPGETSRCVACLAQNASCTFTLPRKTRFYGNIEDLSDRFRCLEALVKGAFPDVPTDSVSDLVRLGQSRGYQMPDLTQNGEAPVKIEEALRIPRQSDFPGENSSSVFSPTSPPHTRPRAKSSPTAYHDSSESIHGSPSLVSDPSGKEHYIGPSGGLQFLGQLRRLLISREQRRSPQPHIRPNAVSKFTEDDGAQALEGEEPHGGAPDSREIDDASVIATRDQRSPGGVAPPESDFTRKSSSGIEDHWRRLPAQEVLEKLLQSFFQNVHDDFVLFHRGTFEGDFELQTRRLRQNGGDLDLGLLACLYMMLVFGSMSDPSIGGSNLDHNALRRHCVSSARSLLPHLISKCTLYNLRALLLLGLFLHNHNERNATWNLVGTATRVAFALGLHRNDTGAAFNPIEREMRKRIFCTLYGFEQFLATSLGRPSGINDPDVEVTPPRAGILDGNGGGGGDAVLVAFNLRLYRILGRSRVSQDQGVRAEAMGQPADGSPEATLADLDQWKTDLAKQSWLNIPPIKTGERLFDDKESGAMAFNDLKSLLHWQGRSALRAALMLQLQYHYTALHATRPFLLQGFTVNTQASAQEQTKPMSRQALLASTCLRHATQMAMTSLMLDSFHLLNGVSGLDIFYVYWASMGLSIGMLQRHPPSEEIRVLETLHSLGARLRDMVAKVEKCGTMKRFTELMSAFAEHISSRSLLSKPAPVDAQESGRAGGENGGGAGQVPPEPAQATAGAVPGSEALDSFYWSHAMMPLGQTIEGGVGSDGFGSWTGDMGGVMNGADWMGSLMQGVDMPVEYGGPAVRNT
ncbi:fungal-specific transcription factor domain-containing protein [Durotheca rogersii]|uniref:fungal-specific transcription factor domain-containing protein n=1 Tax=Durotheca rogersii TaxID=419775 RepID=UPI002220F061|nr:fungal-specific transcription factor domain-containing protein [Durotheca rogersii]KAI5857496.1 fungal-specific transcription factor domain-containing protein [Durotheca rogersii]